MTVPRICPQIRTPGSKPDLGTLITLPEPQLLEIASLAGCDWIFLDCEHGAISTTGLGSLLASAPDVPVLVRIPANEARYVKQALDAGAAGIICPLVEDAAMVERIVRWAKYPPQGKRSVGIGRAHKYGLGSGQHLERANEQTTVVVQVESVAGVHMLDDILKVPGLGGIFVGPYDLSASMGFVAQPAASAVRATVSDVIDRCRVEGVPVGQFFANGQAFASDEIRDRLDFVALGMDTMLLGQSIQAQLHAAHSLTGLLD